jgi:hypothetical protein
MLDSAYVVATSSAAEPEPEDDADPRDGDRFWLTNKGLRKLRQIRFQELDTWARAHPSWGYKPEFMKLPDG